MILRCTHRPGRPYPSQPRRLWWSFMCAVTLLIVAAGVALAAAGPSLAVAPALAASAERSHAAATAAAPQQSAAAARADIVLTVTGVDGVARELTMAELQALQPFTGSAGYLDVIGRPDGPHSIRGVRLADLLGLVAHEERSPVTVWSYHPEFPSPDDYPVTFSADQVQGRDITVYSAQKPYAKTTLAAGDSLVPVVAYEENGAPIAAGPDGEGPLRFWFAWQGVAGAGYLVDANRCVRWTNRIVVRPAPPTWTLKLRGAKTVAVDREAFARLASSAGRTVKVAGHRYQGVPLFRLVGRVDGGGTAFNAKLARKGYSIDLRSSGRRVTLSSKRIAVRPADVLVAWKRDGKELTGSVAPLVFTGKIAAAKRLTGLTSITLRGLPR